MAFRTLPFDINSRCILKMSTDLAMIDIVDSAAPVRRLIYELKFTLVDVLGLIGKMFGRTSFVYLNCISL